jgi:hypothetical protein
MASKALRVQPDLRDQPARQELRDPADLQDHRGLPVHLDPRGHKGLQGRPALQDLLAVEGKVQVPKDHRARPDLRDLRDLQDLQDPQGLQDHRVQRVRTRPCKDLRGLPGSRAMRARPALRAILARWGRPAIREHKDLQVREVIPDHVGLRGLKVRKETKENPARKARPVHRSTSGSSTAVSLLRPPEKSSTLRTTLERTR